MTRKGNLREVIEQDKQEYYSISKTARDNAEFFRGLEGFDYQRIYRNSLCIYSAWARKREVKSRSIGGNTYFSQETYRTLVDRITKGLARIYLGISWQGLRLLIKKGVLRELDIRIKGKTKNGRSNRKYLSAKELRDPKVLEIIEKIRKGRLGGASRTVRFLDSYSVYNRLCSNQPDTAMFRYVLDLTRHAVPETGKRRYFGGEKAVLKALDSMGDEQIRRMRSTLEEGIRLSGPVKVRDKRAKEALNTLGKMTRKYILEKAWEKLVEIGRIKVKKKETKNPDKLGEEDEEKEDSEEEIDWAFVESFS